MFVRDKIENENRESFMKRIYKLGKRSEEEIMLIEWAYDGSRRAHKEQQRDSGRRFFEHAREVALIYLDELHGTDTNKIITLLKHDTGEDTDEYGYRKGSHKIWKKTLLFRLGREFNPWVANAVLTLSGPYVNKIDIKTKKAANKIKIQQIKDASDDIIVMKMIDRLHNLRELKGAKKSKQKKIINETKYVLLPIFLEVNTNESKYLLKEMHKAVKKIDGIGLL